MNGSCLEKGLTQAQSRRIMSCGLAYRLRRSRRALRFLLPIFRRRRGLAMRVSFPIPNFWPGRLPRWGGRV
jgi:hypothetical protein